jgi:hypothetical protein
MTVREDYVPRALVAWYRGSTYARTRFSPTEALSTQITLPDGKSYVVLANTYMIMGVYRIRPSGFLKLLKRWPKAVEAAAGWPRDAAA